MRILVQDKQRLVWEAWPWTMMAVLGTLSIVPLAFGVIGLVEGSGAAGVPILVSILAMILFAVFVGKRRVVFDKEAGEVSVQFRSLLRKTDEVCDLGQVAEVLLYQESDESKAKLVEPNLQPRLKGVRYRSALGLKDGSELSLSGTATKGNESHRIAQTVLKWLGHHESLSDSG